MFEAFRAPRSGDLSSTRVYGYRQQILDGANCREVVDTSNPQWLEALLKDAA